MDYVELLQRMLEDTKQEALAKELGSTQPTLSRWLKGQEPRGLSIERIKEAAARRGLIGSNAFPNTASERGDVQNLLIHAGMGNGGALSVEVDAKGQVTDPASTDGYWSFPDGIRDRWRNMGATYALPVVGDSMAPTLPDGAVVFVDTSHKVPSPADLYAVDYGDGLMVKRVELIPQTENVRIISDNDRYQTYELARETVNVFGRIVAWFQWRG